jgi:hypothetical protein
MPVYFFLRLERSDQTGSGIHPVSETWVFGGTVRIL